MLGRMHLLFDSFWRAAVYCLRPRVMFLSLLPLLLMGGLFLGLGYLYWTPATEALRLWLETATWLGSISTWLTSLGVVKLEAVLAPLLLACCNRAAAFALCQASTRGSFRPWMNNAAG